MRPPACSPFKLRPLFSLPASLSIATDVGALKGEIVERKTGSICRPADHEDLADQIGQYFQSSLFSNLETNREHIRNNAIDKYSQETVRERTCAVYKTFLNEML